MKSVKKDKADNTNIYIITRKKYINLYIHNLTIAIIAVEYI